MSAFVVQLALPETSATLPHSTTLSCVAKLSVPVGLAPLTDALIVNGWFSTNVVMQLVASVVVVEPVPGLTCCVTVFDVDAALFPSPLYNAVIACDPIDSVDVAHDALAPLRFTAVQIAVAPSLNVTVPVGD